jgi:hypothetical protein
MAPALVLSSSRVISFLDLDRMTTSMATELANHGPFAWHIFSSDVCCNDAFPLVFFSKEGG